MVRCFVVNKSRSIITILFGMVTWFAGGNLFAQGPDTLWIKTYGGPENDVGNSVQQTQGGGCIITGWTNSYGAGGYDVYLIKTSPVGIEEENVRLGIEDWRFEVSPNPFTQKAIIHIRLSDSSQYGSPPQIVIYDISGRLVKALADGSVKTGYRTIEWDETDDAGHKLPAGVYFVHLESDDYKQTGKVILLK